MAPKPADPAKILNECLRRMAETEVELEAKGLPVPLIRVALARARGTAEYKVANLNPEIRAQGFLDNLNAELIKAEDWIAREKAFLDEPVSDTSEKGGD